VVVSVVTQAHHNVPVNFEEVDNMRAWLYYRLSRDEDQEMNSLHNQRQILVDYAEQHGYEIVGESFDDNVTGMTFNREGIGKIEDAVEGGLVDTILVKDLSRLGRHRTQTAIFIDYLGENNVNVISVTEGINSADENDDLIIGFKQIVNDLYAKDISKKVRAGVRQKQKDKGLVETLPLGYYKDKNLNKVMIDEGIISNTHLRMLVNQVQVHQNKDKSLDIKFRMNGNWSGGVAVYVEPENEVITC